MTTIKPFDELGLASALLVSLEELGYETPTPIQERSIPVLMQGNDLLAQAQTGTGKTAAFALPALSNIDLAINAPQVLVIAPTRELAIQVAEAFQTYARHLKGFHVTPIYGGQDYNIQLRALKRGAHVIVGTPGRVMDHLRRGTLSTDDLKLVVLDEADEMLKMGFIDDVEWILAQIPNKHQTALFSATMPGSIVKISNRYLKDAVKIQIESKQSTVAAIEQYYVRVANNQKMDVLTRFLEIEDIQAAIIFSRTKNGTTEVAEKLQARGIAAAALNGDMPQSSRKAVIDRTKQGKLDIIVATDVAARGIDIERITHVINFDIPHDTESYIHRIGRTGRAGRRGKALLFVTSRESHLLRSIERAVGTTIKQLEPPSIKEMNEKRAKQLAEKVINVIGKSKQLKPYHDMVSDIVGEHACSPEDVAAALAYLLQQNNPVPTGEIDAAYEPRREGRERSSGGRSSEGRSRERGSRDGDSRRRSASSGPRSDDRNKPDGRSRAGAKSRPDDRSRSSSRSSFSDDKRKPKEADSDRKSYGKSKSADGKKKSYGKPLSADGRKKSASTARGKSNDSTKKAYKVLGSTISKPSTPKKSRSPAKSSGK